MERDELGLNFLQTVWFCRVELRYSSSQNLKWLLEM